VRFYGATLKHRLCLVMEYCDKGSLFSVLSKDKDLELTWDLVFSMLEETVSGIVALHNFSPPILHRDLKTLNVLVTADYKCKVCDFGLSRFATDVETLLKCRGTLAYIAPEVYNQKGFFPQSDVYSLAIMMWEVVYRAITGQYLRPYHEIKMEFVILTQAHQKGRRPPLPDTLPNSFRDLITLCWDPDYQKRPEANQLLEQLNHLHMEYHQNKENWDRFCHFLKNRPNPERAELIIPSPLQVSTGASESSIGTTLVSGRSTNPRPPLRHGGGGSVSKTALSELGVNVSNG